MAKKIIVASGKGGVGKSTVAAGLCRCLRARGKRVLAMDCDVGLRSLDLLLHAGEGLVFDWGDVLDETCTVEQAIVPADGVSLLAAPLQRGVAYTREQMRSLAERLDPLFDYILLDAPAGICGEFHLAAAMADSAIVIATPDTVCLRAAEKASAALQTLGVGSQRLVLNRFLVPAVEHSFLHNIDEAIDRTGVQLLGVIPEDPEVTYRTPSGDALPPKSPAQRAMERIAMRIEGENVPLRLR
jgi:septum site-determining protein MinD